MDYPLDILALSNQSLIVPRRIEASGIIFNIISVLKNEELHLIFCLKCLIVCLCVHLNFNIQSLIYTPRDGISPTRGRQRRSSIRHPWHSVVGFPPSEFGLWCRDFSLSESRLRALLMKFFPLESKLEHNSAVGTFPTHRNYLQVAQTGFPPLENHNIFLPDHSQAHLGQNLRKTGRHSTKATSREQINI